MEAIARITEGLYQAALVSQNPQSSQDQIAQAVQFVEQVKAQDVHTVLQAASQLSQLQQPLEVQVVGLSLLQQQAQHRWRQMNPEAQSTLATFANTTFTQAASAGTAWVLKGKAAQLLASVNTHQGSEAFNSLTSQLLAVGPRGDAAQVELACMVLRYISEDVTHFEEADGVGRKPMLAAIMGSSASVLSFAVQALQHHMSLACQLKGQQDQTSGQRCLGAVAAAFGVASSYMEWVQLSSIASSGLVQALLRFMDVDEFRMSAMDVLKQITSRKIGNEPEEVYVTLMESVAASLVAIADAILKPEYLKALDYGGPLDDFGMRLCATMITFAELHFRCIRKSEDKLTFIREMLKFVEHPYLRLAAQAMQFWLHYLQKLVPPQHGAATQSTSQSTPTPSEAPVKKGTSRGVPTPKPLYLMPYDPPDDVWNELALAMTGHMMHVVLVPDIEVEPPEYFETVQEHREFCANFRGQLKVLMRGISTRVPRHTLQCTTQLLHFCLERACPEQPKPQLLQHLEAAVFCLESVMGMLMEHPDRDHLLPGVSQLLQTLMQYRNPMPAAILLQMRGLEAFGKPLEYLPHMALPLLETALNLLQSIPLAQSGQLPPPSEMSLELKEVNMARLVCAKVLLALARDAPLAWAPHLQSIAQRVEALWQEGKLQEGEKVQLSEGLLCASAALGLEAQQMVLDWMLKPLHTQWTSQEWRGHFTSAQDFVKFFLPWQQDITGKTSIGGRELRWSLYHQLALVERCIRRAPEAPAWEDGRTIPPAHPWNPHMEWVLIPVLQIIACLHGLWTPDMRLQLQVIAGVLDMDPREKAVRLKAAEPRKEGESVSVAGATEASARIWLQGVRDMCYMVVFGASAHCPAFWLCQPVAAFASRTLMVHLESIDHRHLRTVLRHILAFWVVHCPQQLRPQWLAPLLTPLIPHMLARLTQAWGQLVSTTAAPSGSEQQLSEERLQDSLVRDVGKEYMEVLLRTVQRPEVEPNVHSQAEPSSCLDFLLDRDQQLVLVAMATAVEALGWPDTEIAGRAVKFLRLAIPKVGLQLAGMNVVAGNALRGAVTALANQIFLGLQVELLGVARIVCLTYMQHTPLVEEQLQMLPRITPQALENFKTSFFSSHGEKYQRDLMKALLINAGDDNLRSLLLVGGQPITGIKTAASTRTKDDTSTLNGGVDDMFG